MKPAAGASRTVIGFTGTRSGMDPSQLRAISATLRSFAGPFEFHHGLCVGADAQAHALVRAEFAGCRIIGHPPSNPAMIADCEVDERRPALPYLTRNANIVAASDYLIAAPAQHQEITRSGTWSTVRRARKRGVPAIVVDPQGNRAQPRR